MDLNDINTDNMFASIYDENGNYYLIGKNKKVFLINDDESVTEITDQQTILDVLNLFKPGKTDVITRQEYEKD